MPEKITKEVLAENLARQLGLTKKDATEAVNVVISTIRNGLCNGAEVEIRGLFNAKVDIASPCMRRNPSTGEPVPVPEKGVIRMRASKSLKKEVSGL